MTLDIHELRNRDIKRCDAATIFNAVEGMTPEERALVDDYLSYFAAPNADEHHASCLACNSILTGPLGVWVDMPNRGEGEGGCGNCGYPGRFAHQGVGPLARFAYPLQYHPDGVSV